MAGWPATPEEYGKVIDELRKIILVEFHSALELHQHKRWDDLVLACPAIKVTVRKKGLHPTRLQCRAALKEAKRCLRK